MSGYGDKPFGLNNVKLYPLPSGAGVALPVDRVLKFKERVQSGELKGSGKIASVSTISEAVEWELEGGGISLEAYALMTGRTVVSSGTTPTAQTKLTGHAALAFPYFMIKGQTLGDGIDDIHCIIYKAKLTDGLSGDFQDGQYMMTSVKGIGVDDTTNGIYDFIQHETATALPA